MAKVNKTEQIISQHEYNLSADQQEFVKKNYKDTKDLKDLVQECFDDYELDEHTTQYDNVRKYIAKLKRGIDVIDLDDNQVEYIKNNAANARPIDIARTLFTNTTVKPLQKEHRTVDLFIKALNLGNPDYGKDGALKKYSPPRADSKIVAKINAEDISADFDPNDLNAFERKCVAGLRSYLHSTRFMTTINGLARQSHRDLFESTFVQSTYDKYDLNAEEMNMYVSLCRDYVFSLSAQRQLEDINDEIDKAVTSGDDDDSVRLHMALVQAGENKMNEYNKIQTRIEKLQNNLSMKRSERLKNTAEVNRSLARFVELMKEEDERAKALIVAKARDIELKGEVERIQNVPEFVAHVMGVSEDELLNL